MRGDRTKCVYTSPIETPYLYNPVIVGRLNIPKMNDIYHVSEKLAYVASGSERLKILNSNDSKECKIIGQLRFYEEAISIDVSSKYEYFLAQNILIVMDVSNPKDIRIVGKIRFYHWDGKKIPAHESYAYIVV